MRQTVNDILGPTTLMEEIRAAHDEDPRLQKFREQVKAGLRTDVCIHSDDALYFDNRICVPQEEVRQKVLAEAYSSAYSMHLEEPRCIRI